jgi:pimeloyl-ACP methyl ester carboxylesterase
MKKIMLLAAVAFSFSGCLRLDSMLYNSQKITEYKFDAYDGAELEKLDSTYNIAADKRTLFTLNSGGNKIYACYVGDISRIATDTVILYAHGNKYHMDLYWQRVKLLANMGGRKHRYGVLTFDYRGYGLSEGTPTEAGMYEDADVCMAWLKSKGLSNDRLVMYGFSLGSACGTELAALPRSMRPERLILEAPFSNSDAISNDASGGFALPASFFADTKIDNATKIRSVQQPFLWLHGEKDDFLQISTHGEVVWKNYKGTNGTAVRVENAGHSNIPNTMGFAAYMKVVAAFMVK